MGRGKSSIIQRAGQTPRTKAKAFHLRAVSLAVGGERRGEKKKTKTRRVLY